MWLFSMIKLVTLGENEYKSRWRSVTTILNKAKMRMFSNYPEKDIDVCGVR